MVHAYNPNAGEVGTGRALGPHWPASLTKSMSPRFQGESISKEKKKKKQGRLKSQPFTKNCRQLRNAKSGRKSLFSQGRAHQMITQYQVLSPENTHTNSVIQTEQVAFTHTHTTTMKKEVMNLRGNKKGYIGRFGEKDGKGEVM